MSELLAGLLEQGHSQNRGTVADFLEGSIHQSFTVAADWLFRARMMSREERIALSDAIGEALKVYREKVLEKVPGLAKAPMDPELAQHLILKEEGSGGSRL